MNDVKKSTPTPKNVSALHRAAAELADKDDMDAGIEQVVQEPKKEKKTPFVPAPHLTHRPFVSPDMAKLRNSLKGQTNNNYKGKKKGGRRR